MVEEKLDQLQEVILHEGLPAELASRVRSYTEYFFSRQSVYNVDEVLKHLTPGLQRELKDVFLSQSVDAIPLLRVHPKPFKLDIFGLLRPIFTEAAEDIIHKGSCVKDLFFVRRGEVHGVSTVGGQSVLQLGEVGRGFGEHVLLNRTSPFTYTSFTRCELFTVGADELMAAACTHLTSTERERLEREIIHESCRKSRVHYISLRCQMCVLINELHHRSAAKSRASVHLRRTCAALTVQAAYKRQFTLPTAYTGVAGLSRPSFAPAPAPVPAPMPTRGAVTKTSAGAAASATDHQLSELNEYVAKLERTMRADAAKTKDDLSELKMQGKALDAKLDAVAESMRFLTLLCQDGAVGRKYTA